MRDGPVTRGSTLAPSRRVLSANERRNQQPSGATPGRRWQSTTSIDEVQVEVAMRRSESRSARTYLARQRVPSPLDISARLLALRAVRNLPRPRLIAEIRFAAREKKRPSVLAN